MMAFASAAQGLGFIVGPAIAAVFVPMGIDITKGVFVFDFLTQPSYFSALINFICAVLIMFMFLDVRKSLHHLRVSQPVLEHNHTTDQINRVLDVISPSYIGVTSCLVNFFGVLCVFATMETIATPMLMDEYALDRHDAELLRWLPVWNFRGCGNWLANSYNKIDQVCG